MKNTLTIFIVLSLLLVSCNKTNEPQNTQDHLIMSVLWYQKSAEMKALYYQAFNLAKLRLDQELVENNSERQKAVIVDIDETMLDNSPFETNCIRTGKGFTNKRWSEWASKIAATALPGAVEFSQYAKSQDVDIFYISNRSVDDFNVTLKNLQKEKFACADSLHLLLRTNTSSKKLRREIVQNNYDILLLIGDNLGDFSEVFEDRSNNYGFDVVEENRDMFGDQFIVLPNPMDGSWEGPILKSDEDLSEPEKYEMRKAALKGYIGQ